MGWIQGEVGYENCPGGTGACTGFGYPCSNNSPDVAWPRLSSTGCYYSCPGAPNVDQICNSYVYVYNACNADQGWAYVRDCSHAVECCGCGGWCGDTLYNQWPWADPIAELSMGFYLFMGGDLNKGRFIVWICQVPYDC